MTPTSVYRESDTDVCREKYLLEQNARLNQLLDDIINGVVMADDPVHAEQLIAQQEMINNG